MSDMQLNQIKDNEGANKRRIRVGRGIGCTKGKTCGRGVKGQKSRSGVAINGFEGGQMPIHRRLPKRGFTNIHRTEHSEINLGDLQRLADAGVLKAGQEVTMDVLVQAGALRSASTSVKLLGKGALKAKLTLVVDAASKSAVEAVEKAGGSVKLPHAA